MCYFPVYERFPRGVGAMGLAPGDPLVRALVLPPR
jgi:hypothetical protein